MTINLKVKYKDLTVKLESVFYMYSYSVQYYNGYQALAIV